MESFAKKSYTNQELNRTMGQPFYNSTSQGFGSLEGISTGTSLAHPINILFLTPIIIYFRSYVKSMSMNINTSNVTSTYRLGIYKSKNGYPDSLVADVGSFVGSNPTGIKTVTVAPQVLLEPGLYWLASNASGAQINVSSTKSDGTRIILGYDLNCNSFCGYSKSNVLTNSILLLPSAIGPPSTLSKIIQSGTIILNLIPS